MEQYTSFSDYQKFLHNEGDTQDYVEIEGQRYQMGMYDSLGREIQYYLLDEDDNMNENVGFTVETTNRYGSHSFRDAVVYAWTI